MRLAGQMRLKNFLAVVFAGIFALVGISAFGGVWWISTRPAPVPAAVAAPVVAPAVAPATPIAVAPVAAPVEPAPAAVGREVDRIVLSYEGKDIGSDKLKDVTKGQPFKVNIYQDAGSKSADRAKIDLDRDDKWDEKITFEPGKITRQVASKDDEVYDQTTHWTGSGWE